MSEEIAKDEDEYEDEHEDEYKDEYKDEEGPKNRRAKWGTGEGGRGKSCSARKKSMSFATL